MAIRTLGASSRLRLAASPASRRLSSVRRSLLAGTALLAGGVMMNMAAPVTAEAACAITNWNDYNSLGFYSTTCSGTITTEQQYKGDGTAPTSSSSTKFDGDFHLKTDDEISTYIKTTSGNGIYIKSDYDKGYSVEVNVGDNAVIDAKKAAIKVVTTDYYATIEDESPTTIGSIKITNGGYLQSRDDHGIEADSEAGDIDIMNNGIIGLNFVSGLHLDGNTFENGSNVEVSFDPYTEDASAFDFSDIGTDKDGIHAESTDGNIHIVNDGTIYAGDDGIDAQSEYGQVWVENHSYLSNIGADNGVHLHDSNQAIVDNSHGLTIGINEDGVKINDIAGFETDGDAVHVINNESEDSETPGIGFIGGGEDGVYVRNVSNGDVTIDNGGYSFYDEDAEEDVWRRGGLIVGAGDDGVDIASVSSGRVTINNDYTNGAVFPDGMGGLDLTTIDPLAAELLDENVPAQFVAQVVPGYWAGIWGGDNGIKIEDIGDGEGQYGNVDISNVDGIVVGVGEDGIHLRNIASIDEGYDYGDDDEYHEYDYVSADIHNAGGLIWGHDDGIDAETTLGDVNIYNSGYNYDEDDRSYGPDVPGGVIVGRDKGIRLQDIQGDVYVENDGGLIEGYYGDGINIRNVYEGEDGHDEVEQGGHVEIYNGNDDDYYDFNYENPSLIIGGDSAISVRNVASAYIGNGYGSLIIGDGGNSQAVIDLQTSSDYYEGGAQVYNYGIISSVNLPYFDRDWDSLDAAVTPENDFDVEQNYEDMYGLYSYVGSAGRGGDIENLADYSEAAGDLVVKSHWGGDDEYTGGATYVENDGLLIGRVDLVGQYTGDYEGNYGNELDNYGVWLTQDNGEDYASSMHGSSNDGIYNFGLIQTAFHSDVAETATFDQDYFQNGGNGFYDENLKFELDSNIYTGTLSMMDGGTGDQVNIVQDYYGGDYDSGQTDTSVLAIDTFIGAYNDSNTSSDVMNIEDSEGSSIYGSTAVLIHNTNDAPPGLNSDGIPVVTYVGGEGGTYIENPCEGGDRDLCRTGDAFYISDYTPGYTTIDGYGAIRNGLFATFLRQDTEENNFELVTDWGPDARALPGLVTAAQNIWYQTGSVVADHVYGNHFPTGGAGGSGADMVQPTPEAAAGGPALWARIGGSWTNHDSDVTETIGGTPVDFDTGYDQNVYSFLAGADYRIDNKWRFGVFGGYVTSNLDFNDYDISADYTGGTVGAYAAYTSGGFYADAEIKADFLDLDYDSFLGNPSTDVTNIGIMANAGYRFDMGRMFFEPVASVSYLHSDFDGNNYGGADVDFSDNDSFRGGIGARVGGDFATGSGMTELSLLGKIWNEFEDENSVTVTDNSSGDSATFGDSINGVFGEVQGTATYYTADRSLSAFISAGAQFNSDFTTATAKIGLRKSF